MKYTLQHWLFLAMLAAVLGFGPGFGSVHAAEAIVSTNLHNAFAATPRILSGSSPDNDASFAELARLGVKTIISVDGSKPDVDAAKKHGLKYVHLPIGYDGIPTNRVVELVKAAQTLEGPFYVHCHHGKHRGPAAVAVMCEGVAGWSANLAEQWMQQAGTASDYPGLYRSVREFKPPTTADLAAVKQLPEVAQTSSLVDMMVAVDFHFDRLKDAQKSAWREVPEHPELQPAEEATLLWELMREMARSKEKRTADFHAKLTDAEKAAEQFRGLFKQRPIDSTRVEDAFKQLSHSCATCHKQYRN